MLLHIHNPRQVSQRQTTGGADAGKAELRQRSSRRYKTRVGAWGRNRTADALRLHIPVVCSERAVRLEFSVQCVAIFVSSLEQCAWERSEKKVIFREFAKFSSFAWTLVVCRLQWKVIFLISLSHWNWR